MNKTVYVGIIIVIIVALGGYFITKGRDWDGDESYEYQSSEQTQTGGETATTTGSQTGSTAGTSATFTMAQVAQHADKTSCYSAIRGNVYDLTKWISSHPGGQKAILSICGKDGTKAFEGQHGGKGGPEKALESMKIGVLAQ